VSYHEDRYLDHLAERDGQLGGPAWAEGFDAVAHATSVLSGGRVAIVKKLKGDSERPMKKKKAATVTDEAEKNYKLPTTMSEPVDDLGKVLILIHGERKIGKTSMSARAPKNLLMATEIGYRGLRVIPEDIEDWRKAEVVRRALKKDKSFKTITVDTVDILYKLCEDYTCRDLGVKDLTDVEYGKGWRECRKRFEAYLNALAVTGKGVILLSHSTEQEIKKRNGDTYTRITSSMAKQAREIVDGMVDIWGYFSYDGDRRVLVIQGDDLISAGHRFEERFRTPDGRVLKQIDMGRNPEEAWKNFTDAFHNRYTPNNDEDVMAEEEDEERPAKKVRLKKLKKKVTRG
jgi:hypothetical protein